MEKKVFAFRARLEKRGVARAGRERSGWLTPYEVDTLFSDALWAGQGANLDVCVPARATDEALAWVRSRFERLQKQGIRVRVRRDDAWEFRDVAGAGRV